MISTFQSQEFGFGFGFGLNLSNEQLEQVNKACKGQQYVDVRAAVEIKNNAQGIKRDLLESPFVKKFEYGASNNGCWIYQHMVLQLEDFINVLKVLFQLQKKWFFGTLLQSWQAEWRWVEHWEHEQGLWWSTGINAWHNNQVRTWSPWMFPSDLGSQGHTINDLQTFWHWAIFNDGKGAQWQEANRTIEGQFMMRQYKKAELIEQL